MNNDLTSGSRRRRTPGEAADLRCFYRRLRLAIAIFTLCGTTTRGGAPPTTAPACEFLFDYRATITGLRPGQVARVWLPVAPDRADQQARIVARDLPAEASVAREAKYGNGVLYFQAAAPADGAIPFSVTYRVRRQEVGGSIPPASTNAPADDAAPFLRPDARVPVGGKALRLIEGQSLPADPVAAARRLYDVVGDRLQYRKNQPGWGNGDSDWACESRFGNCTDFHSLFISLARARQIPAKFEIGFLLPELPAEPREAKPGDARPGAGAPAGGWAAVPGYHCWAWFLAGNRGWVPVDISEASLHPERRGYYFGHLTANRVAFSLGRDLILEPRQAGPPLNFFIYPYAEVEGKPLAAEQVRRQFRCREIAP